MGLLQYAELQDIAQPGYVRTTQLQSQNQLWGVGAGAGGLSKGVVPKWATGCPELTLNLTTCAISNISHL